MKKSKGFTLIELIVVIAIIGVLAGIATPSIFAYITASQQRADQSSAKQIQAAVSLMFALDSSNTYVDNVTGGVMWDYDRKTKIRDYIHEKLGTSTDSDSGQSLIPRPKENLHAFYMYLLPPYTVVSLKATEDDLYSKGTISSGTDGVNATYLNARYPQINYAQVGTAVDLDNAISVWTAGTIATVGEGTETHVGWLNRGIDYGVSDITN